MSRPEGGRALSEGFCGRRCPTLWRQLTGFVFLFSVVLLTLLFSPVEVVFGQGTDGNRVADAGARETTVNEQSKEQMKVAKGITEDMNQNPLQQFSYSVELVPLPGTKSEELLKNPNRGFRLELNMDIATGNVLEGPTNAQLAAFGELKYYEEESPQLAQVYIYLTQYSERDLDDQALENLQNYFDFFREHNLQILLRFAYEYQETEPKIGPTTAQMLRHIEQLKDILARNRDIIHVIQAGFIGMWGEWHNAKYYHNQRQVLEAIVDMTPPGKQVQVRLAKYKDVLRKDDPRRDRVSYHDDYLVGVDHHWSTATSTDPLFAMYINDCKHMLVDGELPWGKDTYFNNGVIDGVAVAKRLMEHHFTSMSIVHNYKESGPFNTYNIEKWKRIKVDEAFLEEQGFRYDPAWLRDEAGQPITRNIFEYIRDYLGYYIQARSLQLEVEDQDLEVSLELINYGFSAPHGMAELALVLVDRDGQILCRTPACALGDLQPGEVVVVSTRLSADELQPGYKVGILFTNEAGQSAKLANDLPYEKGVNILCELK